MTSKPQPSKPTMPDEDCADGVKIDHYHSQNSLSMLFLQNLNSLFYLGATRPLEQSDLGNLPDESRVPAVHGRFEEAMKTKGDKSIWMVLLETIGWRLPVWGLCLQAVCSASAFAPPQVPRSLLPSLFNFHPSAQ